MDNYSPTDALKTVCERREVFSNITALNTKELYDRVFSIVIIRKKYEKKKR